jgi:hypothetical protein
LSNWLFFAALCKGVSPLFVLALIVSSVSFVKFVLTGLAVFRFSGIGFGADGIRTGPDLAAGLSGVNVTGFSHVGHGIVTPVPSDGNSICCPQ